MTNRNKLIAALVCGICIQLDALAVDGAGLDQVFPALRWIVLMPLFFGASWGIWRVSNKVLANKGITARVTISTMAALAPLTPIGALVFASVYTKYLCSSEAFEQRYVPLDAWVVPAEPFRSIAPGSSATQIAPGVYSHTHNAGLTEIIGSEKLTLGVVSHFNRLVDTSNGTLLAESRYFSDRRGPHSPFGCVRSGFWQWRNEYIEKARRETSKTAVAN